MQNTNVKSENKNNAQSAQVMNTKAAEAKPRALKNLANDESKLEMFGKAAAVRAVKTAYDIKNSKVREYISALGYSANKFKSITADDLDIHSKSGIRFSTWEVLNALKRYAEAADLTGERAAKEARKEEARKLAEARERLREKKAVTKKTAAGNGWVLCANTFGEVVGYQKTDINGVGYGKIFTAEEYEAKKAERAAVAAEASKKAAEKAERRNAKRNNK